MEVVPDDFDSSPTAQTTATEVRVATSRGPRCSSKLQTILPTPGIVEERTDSSVASPESSAPNNKPVRHSTWRLLLQQEETVRDR